MSPFHCIYHNHNKYETYIKHFIFISSVNGIRSEKLSEISICLKNFLSFSFHGFLHNIGMYILSKLAKKKITK